MDRGFILLLFLTSLTGLALLAGRDTSGMGILLALHLGVVMALFLTLPTENSPTDFSAARPYSNGQLRSDAENMRGYRQLTRNILPIKQ